MGSYQLLEVGKQRSKKRVVPLLVFLALFILICPCLLRAQQASDSPPSASAPIEIENADEAEYLRGEEGGDGTLKLRGRIRVRIPNGQFIADTVIIDTQSQEIYAEGNLVFESEDRSRISAERVIYNRRLFQGILYNAAGYKKPVYFIGKNVHLLAKQRLALSHARFTTNAARPPHYHFSVQRLGFYEDSFFAVGVIYYIGGIPLLPLPFLYSSPWGTGIITQLGRGDTQGNFIQNTYQFGVPEREDSIKGLPTSYTFIFDSYQNTGQNYALELARESQNLDYQINLGYARFKRYNVIDGEVTNQVERCEGGSLSGTPRTCTTGEQSFDWHKNYMLIHSKTNDPQKNHVRDIHIFYEDYGHYLYDYEFGRRFRPENTTSTLYRRVRLNEGTRHPNTTWELNYSEKWDSLYLELEAKHREVWRTRENFQDSDYEPARETIPKLKIGKRFSLGNLPILGTPIDWNHELFFENRKDYAESKVFSERNANEYSTDLNFSLPLLSWFYWDIKLGYGARKTFFNLSTEDRAQKAALELEGQRSSYQYLFSENKYSFVAEELLLDLTHSYKSSFDEEQKGSPQISRKGFRYNQNLNESEIDLYYFALPNISFNLNTTYDHRQFPEGIPQEYRWHYPIFRSDIFLDCLNLFQENRNNLLSRNKINFLNTHITNDHVYDPVFKTSHSNILGLSLEMGGYDLWLLRRLRYFEMGFQWYHAYFDPALDHMRYTLKMDLQLGKWSYLETVMESRASEPERYRASSVDRDGNPNSVDFWQDLNNGLGLNGSVKRKEAVFNLIYFSTALIFDLGDWEFRLQYEQEQRYIPETSSGLESLVYYERRISFGLNLIHFDIGGYGKRPSSFLLDRKRSPGPRTE